MALPIQTSAEDAIQVCRYLRTKSTGAPLKDVGAIVGAGFIDARKLQGYETWALIGRQGDALAATALGRQLGQAQDDSALRQVFARVLLTVGPYQKAVEYIRSQGLSQITSVDMGAWWHEHMPTELGVSAEKSIVSAANSFFSVAQAAGLGTFKMGRQGASTRLESIDVQRAAEILDAPSAIITPASAGSEDDNEPDQPEEPSAGQVVAPPRTSRSLAPGAVERVFIAHGKDMGIVQQVADIVSASGLQPEIAEDEETTAIPVPDKVFDAMHRCQAGVICVTREPGTEESTSINRNVLIEIGAAFVLYEKQVILVWDKSLPVPSNLQGLYRCELESNKLSWDEGVKLLRAIGKFKADTEG